MTEQTPSATLAKSQELQIQQQSQLIQQLIQQYQQVQDQLHQAQQQLTSMNHNMAARVFNASIQRPTDPLAPLVNLNTGKDIDGFPVDSTTLAKLKWPDMRKLGVELAINVPAADADEDTRGKFLVQLRVAIGLQRRSHA